MHSAGTVVSLERRKNNHLTGCCSYYTFNPVEGVSNTIGPHMSAREFEWKDAVFMSENSETVLRGDGEKQS